MAKGKKTGGRNFQKGVQTYFGKLSEEEKVLRKLSRDTFKSIIAKNLLTTVPELEYKLADEDHPLPACEVAVIVCILGAARGDEKKLEIILSRCLGKPKDIVVNEKKISVSFVDSQGNEVSVRDIEKLDTASMRQVVETMLRMDDTRRPD